MGGTTPWTAQNLVEPIAAETIQAIANMAGFSTISGCAATYSGVNMQKTIASGSVLHTSAATAVAGNTVTLVSDPTNPRWTYTYVTSGGVAAIVSGSPAATPAVPDPGANPTNGLDYVQAALTIANNATYKLDKRVLFPAPGEGFAALRYKTATQQFTTDTTFADVVAANGTLKFSFAIAPSGIWIVDYWIAMAFGGTGGAKFQLTGPAAPVGVNITGWYDATQSLEPFPAVKAFTPVTAFSTAINSQASNTIAAGAPSVYPSNALGANIHIHAVILNGTTAGAVVLQAAQNNANSTLTLGLGSYMSAVKVA